MAFNIYLLKIKQPIGDALFEWLMPLTHPKKKERINKQKVKQNADNMLMGELLVKYAVKKHFGIKITEQSFSLSPNGKPCLNGFPHIHFNLSHSGNVVVCAVGDVPLGIDIQKQTQYNPKLAQRVCNLQEIELLEQAVDKNSLFTKLWTKKEAVLKMQDTGITKSNIKDCLANHRVQSFSYENYWISICEKS